MTKQRVSSDEFVVDEKVKRKRELDSGLSSSEAGRKRSSEELDASSAVVSGVMEKRMRRSPPEG